jgi:hypothetical protein
VFGIVARTYPFDWSTAHYAKPLEVGFCGAQTADAVVGVVQRFGWGALQSLIIRMVSVTSAANLGTVAECAVRLKRAGRERGRCVQQPAPLPSRAQL